MSDNLFLRQIRLPKLIEKTENIIKRREAKFDSDLSVLYTTRNIASDYDDEEKHQWAMAKISRLKSSHPRSRRHREQRLARLRQQLADVEAKIKMGAGADSISPMRWRGTAKAFGQWILDKEREKLLVANSPTDALKQACRHFVNKKGEPFKPESIWELLRRDVDNGGTDYARKP